LKYFNDLCHKTYFNRNFGAVALVCKKPIFNFRAKNIGVLLYVKKILMVC